MSEKLQIIYTRHAREMLIERTIERDWVDLTVGEPDIQESDPERPEVVRAFRHIPERENRLLRVVYIKADEVARVITVFFDRNRSRAQNRRNK